MPGSTFLHYHLDFADVVFIDSLWWILSVEAILGEVVEEGYDGGLEGGDEGWEVGVLGVEEPGGFEGGRVCVDPELDGAVRGVAEVAWKFIRRVSESEEATYGGQACWRC